MTSLMGLAHGKGHHGGASGGVTVNRVGNGDFEVNTADWFGFNWNETLSRDTGAPLSGTGSLKVVTPGEFENEGAHYPDHGDAEGDQIPPIAVTAGEPLRVMFKIKGVVALIARPRWDPPPPSSLDLWSATLTGAMVSVSVDVTVPADVTSMRILFGTPDTPGPVATTFYLDDLVIGTPA